MVEIKIQTLSSAAHAWDVDAGDADGEYSACVLLPSDENESAGDKIYIKKRATHSHRLYIII